MGFQIHNAEGKAISIKELDVEAATFWGKEVHPTSYACPQMRKKDESGWNYAMRYVNWFDVIGWCIHNQGHACSGWSNVVSTMIAETIGMHFIDTSEGYKERPVPIIEFVECKELVNGEVKSKLHLPDKIEEKIYCTLQFYKPYIELINHWQSKGYVPVKIKDN